MLSIYLIKRLISVENKAFEVPQTRHLKCPKIQGFVCVEQGYKFYERATLPSGDTHKHTSNIKFIYLHEPLHILVKDWFQS